MDLIHKVLNIVVPLTVLSLLSFFLPLLVLLKTLSWVKRLTCSEKLSGKVVLITGASSGIGEHLAYEYARRGACLALAARRDDRLQVVADKARLLGASEVLVIRTDVSKIEDCKQLIDEAVNQFGRLDHLVNNASVLQVGSVEDFTQISDLNRVMDTNFWGSVYCTHFAVPHLRKSKGRIIVISSISEWIPVPRLGFYCASKAALMALYETLSIEIGCDIGITIVTPGLVSSEMTGGEFRRKNLLESIPVMSTEGCAKAIVSSACRGDKYLTEPFWWRIVFLLKIICPDVLDWIIHSLLVAKSFKKSP